MFKYICLAACLLAAGCAPIGYWPKVAAGMDTPKYQSDVRECQTDYGAADRAPSANPLMYAMFGVGGLVGGSKGIDGTQYMDACMTQRGYTISRRYPAGSDP